LKVELTRFQLVPPFLVNVNGSSSPEMEIEHLYQHQLLIAREVFEWGIFLAVQARDLSAFQRNLAQLKPYYTDYAHLLPTSDKQSVIIGLQLLHLLCVNALAEFHSEVELLSYQDQHRGRTSTADQQQPQQRSAWTPLLSSPYISYPLQLETYLMEGCYHRISAARASVPSPEYRWFLELLFDTIRHRIADQSSVAYDRYPMKGLSTLLMIDEEDSATLKSFIHDRAPSWQISSDGTEVLFIKSGTEGPSVNSMQLITQTLT